MADLKLEAAPILGDAHFSFGDSNVVERHDLALVSVSTPQGGDAALAAALKRGWSLDAPAPTLSTVSDETRAIRTAPDQIMLVFPHPTPDANTKVQGKLNGTGYTTDQTDAWVVLELSGPLAISALERLCPLDLHDSAFPVNAAGRTKCVRGFILETTRGAVVLGSILDREMGRIDLTNAPATRV